MRWIILKDVISKDEPQYNCELRGSLPKNLQNEDEKAKREWAKTLPFEFRLFDDDGELYYEGRCGDLEAADGDNAFAPLDWAEANDGCTRMDYRKVGEQEWETL